MSDTANRTIGKRGKMGKFRNGIGKSIDNEETEVQRTSDQHKDGLKQDRRKYRGRLLRTDGSHSPGHRTRPRTDGF
jgi:hypothetical protein